MRENVNWDTQAVQIAMGHSPQLTTAARKVAIQVLGQMIATEVWKVDKKELIESVRNSLKEIKPLAQKALEEKLAIHVDGCVQRFFDREMY